MQLPAELLWKWSIKTDQRLDILEGVFQDQGKDIQDKMLSAEKFVSMMQNTVSDIADKVRKSANDINASKDTRAALGERIGPITAMAEKKLTELAKLEESRRQSAAYTNTLIGLVMNQDTNQSGGLTPSTSTKNAVG